MGDFKKKQKEEAQKQKEKEAAALAKIEMLKVEKSKNKVISSVGKGLVSNKLASKLQTISQNKGQIQTGLPSIATSAAPASGKPQYNSANTSLQPNSRPGININHKTVYLKGKQIGWIDFSVSAKKYNLEKINEYTMKKYSKIFLRIEDSKEAESNLQQVQEDAKQAVSNIASQSINSNSTSSRIKGISSVVMQNAKEVTQEYGSFSSQTRTRFSPQQNPAAQDDEEEEDDELSKWMQVNKARENEIQHKLNKNYDEVEDTDIKPIQYSDAWDYFMGQDYRQYLDSLEIEK